MAKYYESDITKMLRDLLQNKPHIAEEQRKGRGLWWDKKLDLDMMRRFQESRVARSPYAYQNTKY
ncbi:MAG: DUF3460 domain-containing protein [Betaproteobacteria bacterium RIFCSPLOWO2_12_FULL_66_14]|nr:MAG: DUF3460 domain-containing protein [Betaproteobacteria bacterium RIFCSPLOWO2_12_FULL_66_14]